MEVIPIFVQQVIGVLVRVVVTFLAGWMVAHGGPHLTDSDITNAIISATPVVAMTVWGIWQRYHSRVKLMTALSMEPSTEAQVERVVANPSTVNPSVNTSKQVVPTLEEQK